MRLHSHDINWGSGSGQQSVTTHGSIDDPNSLWIIQESQNQPGSCPRGKLVNCGSTIKLKHASTGKFLHSHKSFKSVLSGNQEISGFTPPGDSGDDWIVDCRNSVWSRGDEVTVKHKDTVSLLTSSTFFY